MQALYQCNSFQKFHLLKSKYRLHIFLPTLYETRRKIPWIVVNAESTSHRNSISYIRKRALIQLLIPKSRKSRTTFNLCCSSNSQSQFSILTPDGRYQWRTTKSGLEYPIDKKRDLYLRKSTASPETSFFLLTNALHPVVSKCLRGWPAQTKKENANSRIKQGKGNI
jgi:hypothetical protein